MHKFRLAVAAGAACAYSFAFISSSAYANTPQDVFGAYGAALNAGNARAAADTFSIDGVFSQAGAPVVTGREAIFTNLEGLFSVVSFNLDFTILDLSTFGDLAYVWSRSDGTISVGGGAPGPASYRELFIMERGGDANYLIDQYYFAPAGGVPAVPEPGTWLMLSTGVGFVGYLLRKRRKADLA